ncbi:hydratase [Leadbettera azotonutricia]|uniref:Aconitase family protein n=1 Tax=Leadbettera azotonutricia (strain ATCC BAA-888 / DSM 13862 / ZAS-9) TaxID=545695 RepID=F5Y9H8_LEAAZ|nr:hydratase [Leadbettera azotonutricia]AEF82449.1 aconitase family protein [Leadbettera azotonutricia ZAS-9]
MVKVIKNGVFLLNGREIIEDNQENRGKIQSQAQGLSPDAARLNTIAAGILLAHNQDGGKGLPQSLHLNFDAMASHDITFVNIIQTAKVSGLDEFPIPYILTNCHNSLCAVGGTINEDDHLFGLSAAKRYGGVYVPPHLAVIHSYMREAYAGCGKMILGSDSHTRYGSLGTMGIGEGGGELVKQLLRQSYDAAWPRIIAVYLSGKPRNGVGPQDIALAIIGAVFKDGFAKNAVLEFVGDGIKGLAADYRAGIDVMTTETACWSSIWETDETTAQYLAIHYRDADYKKLSPGAVSYYDGLIHVDLASVKPMIALPFHPSNVFEIDDVIANPKDIFGHIEKDAAEVMENPNIKLKLTDNIDSQGRIRVDQAVVAGCAGGTFDNLMTVKTILAGHNSHGGKGNEGFTFSVYPGSQPILLELAETGGLSNLINQGIIVRSAFCGPCFGAGDVPANNGLSIRHTTRNFPNREGSKPGNGQISSVCLMDARSIAATALNGGYLASAEHLDQPERSFPYHFGPAPYLSKIYNGIGKPDKSVELRYGPNITDWPPMAGLGENLLLKIVSYITDPVTTTDELIPSGETSSFRSNPLGLAEYTLSRKDPSYVGKAKAVQAASKAIAVSETEKAFALLPELTDAIEGVKSIQSLSAITLKDIQLASAIYAHKPGDGSAREQAASCQRVLGGSANFAHEYATKRYRSNLINWGILPFIIDGEPFKNGDYVFIPKIAEKVRASSPVLEAWVISGKTARPVMLKTPELNPGEVELILDGSLINHNRKGQKK